MKEYGRSDDEYKSANMSSLTLISTLVLFAGDGMLIFNDLFILIKDPSMTNWSNYLTLGMVLWAIPNNILISICAIGQDMDLWKKLIGYMWMVFAAFITWEVYTLLSLLKGIALVTDSGVKEELTFFFILAIALDTVFVIRQFAFLELYKEPTTKLFYILPYPSHLMV